MSNKLTNDEFIKKSNMIHHNKYDYSLVDYIDAKTKVKIICPIHGIFQQSPQKHLIGQGCPKCSNTLKKTLEDFIIQSNNIHHNKYDYSLTNYKNIDKKVSIICPIHGVFEQRPDNHLQGQGCPDCGGTKKLTEEEFIQKSLEINGDKYDYSLVNYKNIYTKVNIICPIHGIFQQTPNKHINGQGCPFCANNIKYTNDIFIKKSKKVHNDKYDYSLVDYKNNRTKVKIICPIHGCFEQLPDNHISKKQGCPICYESKGERVIRNILITNDIDFIRQKKFKNCKHLRELQFDFYLPYYNICIEYDGIQHFTPRLRFGGFSQYENTVLKDRIKNNYCEDNNIYLYRISYKDNIIDKMDILLKKININI